MTDEVSALRREVEEARRLVALWESAAEMLGAGAWEHDIATGLGRWSAHARRSFGLGEDAIPVSLASVLAAVHPEDRVYVREFLRVALEQSDFETDRCRHRIVRPTGEWRWLETSVRVERDSSGTAVRLVGATIDRTDAHRDEERLRRIAVEARALVEQASDGIFITTPTGRHIDVNESACAMLGYSREELLGRTTRDVMAPDEPPPNLEALVAGENVVRELRLRRKDGTYVWVELSARIVTGGRVHTTARNIDARRAAEQAWRESNQTLRELGANLPALLWVRDAKSGRLVYVNTRWASLMRKPPVAGEHFHGFTELVHPDDLERLHEASRRLRDSDSDDTVRFVAADGSVSWHRVRGFAIRDASGEPYRIAGFAVNIDAQRAAEQALRDSEARYRSVILAMSDGIVVHGVGGEIIQTNPSAERMLGLSHDQLVGRTSLDPRWHTIREDGSPFPGEEHPGWVTLRTGEPQTGVIMGVHEPNGTLRWLMVNSRRVTDPGEEGTYSVVASFADITERRAAEERIAASLREKEVLLKEIHHRVKNNLQIISSLLYLQSIQVDEPRLAALFKESQGRVASMALVHEMLYESPDLSRISFAKYIRQLGTSLGHSFGLIPSRVSLEVEAADFVLGIDTAIPCGLLLNEILTNSMKHAYPEGRSGCIRIELGLAGDGRCRLVASDDGVGMPADFDDRRSSSLGATLIERLVAQIGGSMRRTNANPGTSYLIEFSGDLARPRDPS